MLKCVGIAAIVTLTIASAARGGNSVTYQYDTAGRLRTATYCSGVATAYSLDGAGNRITVNATGNSGLPAEDPNGVPDALSFTAAGVQISLGQTVQVKVDRACSSAGALTATYSVTANAPSSDYSVSGSLSWAAGDTSSKYLTVVFTSTPTNTSENIYITVQPASPGNLGLFPSYQLAYGTPVNTQPVNCAANPASCT